MHDLDQTVVAKYLPAQAAAKRPEPARPRPAAAPVR
jgi:hypothetical protein